MKYTIIHISNIEKCMKAFAVVMFAILTLRPVVILLLVFLSSFGINKT